MTSPALLGTDPLGSYGSCSYNPGDADTFDPSFMSTRVGYVGLSPESALPTVSDKLQAEQSQAQAEPDDALRRQHLRQSLAQHFWSNNKEVLEENHGLLLVVGSQAFLSMVNIAVKQLNSIDPPVSVLEVRFPHDMNLERS